MIRAILIDDEISSLQALMEKLLRHCPEVQVVALCESAEKGINAIEALTPDVVFLDIEMPLMNGFTLLQQLSSRNFELIFVTAYDHYAINAIRFSALDYLLKPVEVELLQAAIKRVQVKRNEHTDPNLRIDLLLENLKLEQSKYKRIAIPSMEGLQFIRTDEIKYLEAQTNYSFIYLSSGQKYTASRSLKDFEEILPHDHFFRIHHAYIININYLEKYIRGEGGQVMLSGNITLDVSKRKKQAFLQFIGP